MAKKSSDIDSPASSTITLRNRTRQHLVFNLPHASYCAEGSCACEPKIRTVQEYDYQTEEHTAKVVDFLVCASASWLAGESKDVDPRVLRVSDIARALDRGDLVKC